MTTNNPINSYTLQMQTSTEYFSMAIRDLIDHFDWGYNHNKLVFIYEKQTSKRKQNFFFHFTFFCFKGLDLLSDVLRVKNNRQPTIILKALTTDSNKSITSRSILTELRYKIDPSNKIIIAISQKSLDQFLIDVREKKPFYRLNQHILFVFFKAQKLGIVSTYYHLLIVGIVSIILLL